MKKENLQKALVFFLTFLSYAGLHCLREGWSYSKPELKKAFNISNEKLGLIDTLYLISYSLGMATIGNLSSKMNLKYFICLGMILSSLFYMSFSIYFQISHTFSYIFVVVVMCFNGFFQSTGWPGVMAVMGNWFGKGKRGLLMGVWAINANVGNIIASVLCNILEQKEHLSWISNFLFTGGFCLSVAVLLLLFLKQKPQQRQQNGFMEPLAEEEIFESQAEVLNREKNQKESLISEQSPSEDTNPQKKPVNVLTAFFLPRVPFYVVGYSCTKGCIYGLLFWLPTYLEEKGLNNEKGYIAAMVDVGCFMGGLIVGYLGDRYKYKALFLSPLLFMSSIVMFIVSFALTKIAWMYYVTMLLIGIMTGGPYNIIGSAITIDLGEQAGKENIGKVSALIEGSAALFSALSQIIISFLPFNTIFYLFCGESIIAAAALLPLFLKDLKQIRSSPHPHNGKENLQANI